MWTYETKISRGCYSYQQLKNATTIYEGQTVNAAAREFGMRRMTFTRFMKRVGSEGG